MLLDLRVQLLQASACLTKSCRERSPQRNLANTARYCDLKVKAFMVQQDYRDGMHLVHLIKHQVQTVTSFEDFELDLHY